MGVIAVEAVAVKGGDSEIERLGETQWLRRRGHALITLSLLFRFDASVAGEEPRGARYRLYLPYRVGELQDTSKNWSTASFIEYFSNTSGDYYRLDAEGELVDGSGPIFVNGARLSLDVTRLPNRPSGGCRHMSCVSLELERGATPATPRHIVQLTYTAERVAIRRTRMPLIRGPNWYFANRYYSVYDMWDPRTGRPAASLADDALVPVRMIDNWLALPGSARAARFSPTPSLESMVWIDHPGYPRGFNPIHIQTICRFGLPVGGGPNPWFSAYTFGEYEDQPIPFWVAYAALLATLAGLVATLVGLIITQVLR